MLVCQNETATGVTSDVAAVRQAMDSVKHPALLFVDSVSALASIDFRMDEWGVDVCVSGSQKGLMLPAGLGVTCVSQKALEAAKTRDLEALLFRLRRHGASQCHRLLSLHAGAADAVRPARVARHARRRRAWRTSSTATRYLAGGVRAAVLEGWKLKLCATAPKWYSDTVSAIMVPEGINGADVIARAFRRYNLALGAGLSKVAGKLFRIGHLGDLNELMLLGAIAGAEMAMLDVGVKIEPGSGVAAAQKYWRSNSRPRARAKCDEQDRHRGMMQRVVFLDRASLKANGAQARVRRRVRGVRQDLGRGDRAAPRGRDRRDHQQGADARADARAAAAAEDDRGGGDRLRRRRRRRTARSTASRSRTSATTRCTPCRSMRSR